MPLSAWCGNLSGNELTRSWSGNTRPQSSQLVEPLWTDPGLKSGVSVHELISTLRRRKKAQAGRELSNNLPNPRTRGKSHHRAWVHWDLDKAGTVLCVKQLENSTIYDVFLPGDCSGSEGGAGVRQTIQESSHYP